VVGDVGMRAGGGVMRAGHGLTRAGGVDAGTATGRRAADADALVHVGLGAAHAGLGAAPNAGRWAAER